MCGLVSMRSGLSVVCSQHGLVSVWSGVSVVWSQCVLISAWSGLSVSSYLEIVQLLIHVLCFMAMTSLKRLMKAVLLGGTLITL